IVHSRYVETLVREHGYVGPLHRIPHPAWPVPAVAPAEVEGSPLIGSFGHINENKRVPQLLTAFAGLRRTRHSARLLLVGSESPGFDLAGRIERTGLDASGVIREGYVEEERLWSLMAASDAIVLLRAPTMGETSGAAIRALSLGKPIVVSDVGWFAELPDSVAIKIPVGGEEEVQALTAALRRLADPEAARAMGEAGRALVERDHRVETVAERYAAALEEAAGAGTVRAAVLQEVATAAADVGIAPEPLASDLVGASLISRDGAVSVPGTGRWPLSTLPIWAWLGALYAVAVTIQLALALRVTSPWIMVDEIVYSDMARSFAKTGHFLIRGVHGNYGFVYPLLLSPVYRAIGPMSDVHHWSQVVNALVICSAVVPAYLLARRVVRPGTAVVAAALAVAIPSTAYAGTLMTENVFYPVFLWLALALVAALERPTRARQIVLLAACALAFVTRAQTVAIVVAVLSAPVVLAWIERGRPQRLKAFAPLYGIVAGAAVIVIAVEVARGRSPAAILGNYSVTSNGGYRPWPAIEWLVFHLAELDLAVFVLPFAALIVLVANARHLDRRLRVYVAASASLSVWLVLEVAVFASRYSQRIEERNLFYLMPLLVIALLAWIERGQPLPPRASVAAAGIAAALPGAIPFAHLFNITAQSDTIGLQPWWFLGNTWTGRHAVGAVAVVLALTLAGCFLWLPRRYAPVLPALVATGFLLTWLPLELWTHSFPRLASSAYAQGVGLKDKSWIDDAVGRNAHVGVIFAGGNDLAVLENEYWNRSVDRVYGLGARLPGDMPEIQTSVDPTTGALRGITERYVLAPSSVQLVGTRVAADPAKQLVLYRVAQPARITTHVVGLYPATPGT
ncbi:MAG TPA: glycosyltransferase family 4 protein, partial [Gaiellaceae bacterium]